MHDNEAQTTAVSVQEHLDVEVLDLLHRAADYAIRLYPPESVHQLPVQQLQAPNATLLVARVAGRPAGCVVLIVSADGSAEIKSLFVEETCRRNGIGRTLLRALEEHARQQLVTVIRLETGTRQPEAIKLYRKSGFRECRPFGNYRPDPVSVFMEKALVR